MSGIDSGKASATPANDGPGGPQHEGAGPDPDAASVVPGPWHNSRPRRPLSASRRRIAPPTGGKRARAWLPRFQRIPLPQFGMPSGKWAPWLGGAIVLLWLGTTMLHRVAPNEQAIVATFGADGPVLGPGLVVSWPWPIAVAHITDVTGLRHLVAPAGGGEQLLLTSDGKLVDLAIDVRWHIGDLRRHDIGLADPAITLQRSADAALRTIVAGMDYATVTGAGRAVLVANAARQVQAMMDRDQAGITVDGIDIRHIGPPAHVAAAMHAVAGARSDAAAETAQAQAWSRQWIAHAQGEAGAFDKVYAQYRLSPEVTRQQMYYATMERVLSQTDKVIVDAPGAVIRLPSATPDPKADHGR